MKQNLNQLQDDITAHKNDKITARSEQQEILFILEIFSLMYVARIAELYTSKVKECKNNNNNNKIC